MSTSGHSHSGEVTVMIRHIACRYTKHDVKQVLDGAGLRGTFTYIYVPRVHNSNAGYAFVRFTSVAHAHECARRLGNRPFGQSWSPKVCSVEWANFQGEARLLRRNQDGPMPNILWCSVGVRHRGRRSSSAFASASTPDFVGTRVPRIGARRTRPAGGTPTVGIDIAPIVSSDVALHTISSMASQAQASLTPMRSQTVTLAPVESAEVASRAGVASGDSAQVASHAGAAPTRVPHAYPLDFPISDFFDDIVFEGIPLDSWTVAGLAEGVKLPPVASSHNVSDFGQHNVPPAPCAGDAGSAVATALMFCGKADGMPFRV